MKENSVAKNEKLMKEWNWEKNNALNIFPDQLTCGSNKKVWWRCKKCNYEWMTSSNNRSRGTNCPACAHKVVVEGVNDLMSLYPELAKRWHPTLNTLKPTQVFPKSNKIAFWLCDLNKEHFFKTRIDHMVNSNIKCPICANQQVIQGVNDLITTNPQLAEEWDYQKNKDIDPTKITYGNATKVWWKCKQGHSWMAIVGSRAGKQKTGCPICKKELFISFPEKCIAYYLGKEFAIEENKKFSWLGNSELDIYIPSLNMGVEYDGKAWHKNCERDLKKDDICKKHGITLVRVREKDCPYYESSSKKIIRENEDEKGIEEVLNLILDYICVNFNKKLQVSIDIERDYYEILSHISRMQKEKSIYNSQLISEWNYEKNGELNPRTISIGSKRKVWWICNNGHEWQAVVYSRASSQKCGCPYCAGQKVVSGWNDLETNYANIAKEWDYNKNKSIIPSQIMPHSNKKYWWKCSKCDYSWQASAAHRVEGRGCPNCARQKTISSHFKQVVCVETKTLFMSIKEAGEKTGINPSAIANCCRGASKSAGGFHWEYVDNKKD